MRSHTIRGQAHAPLDDGVGPAHDQDPRRPDEGRDESRISAVSTSAIGTLRCVDAWVEDFREDLPRNDVATVILHGDADRILPPDATSCRQAKMIRNCKFVELKNGPHPAGGEGTKASFASAAAW